MITQVDFYILRQNQSKAWSNFICRLLDKIYRKNHQVVLHAQNLNQANTFNDLLWSWRQDSFIPHEILEQPADSNSKHCQIIINYHSNISSVYSDVLVNISDEIPPFSAQFSRIVEIVKDTEADRALRKLHYRHYQDQGYQTQSHEIR